MENTNQKSELSREDFLRGLAAGAAGALSVAFLGACANNAATPSGEPADADAPADEPAGSDDATPATPAASSALAAALAFDPEAVPPAAKRVAFLAGTWEEMGTQYAEQYPDAAARFLADGVFSEEDFAWYQANAPEFAQLMTGMCAGLGVTPEELYPLAAPAGDGHNCSTSAAWGSATAGGRLLVASNHDTLAVNDYFDPIVVGWPADGNAFVTSSGFQGNMAMNDKGMVLTGSSGQNAGEGDIAVGLPAMVDFPILASKVSTVVEADELYNTYKGHYSSNYSLHDASGDHLVIEQSNAHRATRKPGDFGEVDYLITTNDFMTDEMQSSVLPAGSGYDDCRPRYYTEEHVIKAAAGEANLDTMADAMSVCDGYYDENDEWNPVSWDFGDFGLFSPENVSPWFHCFEKALADPENQTMYVMNGCRNAFMTWLPAATGNFVHVTLAATPEEVVDSARMDANNLIYDAGADVSAAKGSAREAMATRLDEAKAAFVAGENLYAGIFEVEGDDARRMVLARACSEYLRAQALAQLACADTTSVIRPLLFND